MAVCGGLKKAGNGRNHSSHAKSCTSLDSKDYLLYTSRFRLDIYDWPHSIHTLTNAINPRLNNQDKDNNKAT